MGTGNVRSWCIYYQVPCIWVFTFIIQSIIIIICKFIVCWYKYNSYEQNDQWQSPRMLTMECLFEQICSRMSVKFSVWIWAGATVEDCSVYWGCGGENDTVAELSSCSHSCGSPGGSRSKTISVVVIVDKMYYMRTEVKLSIRWCVLSCRLSELERSPYRR